MTLTGVIFDIQRFSVHDGPGIRTTVFFKGCSLRCFWCHNPEGLQPRFQIQFQENRCIHCGECVVVCPEQAQGLVDGVRSYDRSVCQTCGQCVMVCFAEALVKVGRKVTVDEVMSEILADRAFYETSGGGMTLSGGEPALQPEFSASLLEACKNTGINTAIETAGNVPWESIEKMLPFTDLVMLDLKLIDPYRHRQVTGVSNERILENAKRFIESGKPIIFRTPIIPTVNDAEVDIAAIADFIRSLSAKQENKGSKNNHVTWELLVFHRLAADKYRSLGMEYQARNLDALSKEQLTQLVKVAQSAGIPIKAPV